MEQYAAMSEQMQNYNLWEEDYNYYTGEMGMLGSQELISTNFYARNVQQQHVVSSPETAKPKRRRSKSGAAAAQSTTFLNASISNFRALVQQHTGCHSSPKGPITLCFASPAEARQLNDQNQYHYS